jgi:tetratricopeptide (TPR) repeat protein
VEAIPVLESALPAWKKTYPSDLDLPVPLSFLARAYLQTSQFEKAEAAAAQAVQIQTGKIDPNTVRAAICELLLAQALQGQRRVAEALPHAEKADREYAAVHTMSAAEKVYAAQAHQLVVDLQNGRK